MKKIIMLLCLLPIFLFARHYPTMNDTTYIHPPNIFAFVDSVSGDTIYIGPDGLKSFYIQGDSIYAIKINAGTYLNLPAYPDSAGVYAWGYMLRADTHYTDSAKIVGWNFINNLDTLGIYLLKADTNYTDSIDVKGWGYFNTESELTNLLNDDYNYFTNADIVWDTLSVYVLTSDLDYTDSLDVKGWNFFNTEAELTNLLNDNYNWFTNDSINWDTLGVYVKTADLDYTDSLDVKGWNYFNTEGELTTLLDDNYNWFTNDSIAWDTLGAYLDTNTIIGDSAGVYAWGYMLRADTNYTDSTDVAGWGFITSGASEWTDMGSYLKPNEDGDSVLIYDTGGTKFLSFKNNGTNSYIKTSAGHLFLVGNAGSYIQVKDANGIIPDVAGKVLGWSGYEWGNVYFGQVYSGYDGVDGRIRMYSEQGMTDYKADLYTNTAMTSDASFYLPVDEPTGTYLLNMTSGGVIGYDATAYLPKADTNYTDSLDVKGWNFFNTEAELTALLNNNYMDINETHIDSSTYSVYSDTADYALDSDKWDGNQFVDYINQAIKTTSDVVFDSLYVTKVNAGTYLSLPIPDSAFHSAYSWDSDKWDGNQFASYLNQAVLMTSDVKFDSLHATKVNAGTYLNLPVPDSSFHSAYAWDSDKWDTYQFADYLDQSVKQASGVTFATVNTGQGDNELYDMNQNVLSTSDVDFDSLYATKINAGTYLNLPTRVDSATYADNPTWTDTLTFQASIFDPDGIQSTSDAVPILAVESSWAPSGIKVLGVGIKTNANSTYAVNFEEWTSPLDVSPSTILAITTSASAEVDSIGPMTDSDIAAGSIIYIDLPTTDVNFLQIWGIYYIK